MVAKLLCSVETNNLTWVRMNEAQGMCDLDRSSDVNNIFEIKIYVFYRKVQFRGSKINLL